jgi:hypothetical protein
MRLKFNITIVLFLLFIFSSSSIYSQSHCCCAACPGTPCIVNADGGCAASCFFSCGNPGNAEDANDDTCLGTSCNPLPAELVLFKAKKTELGVELEWRTESEINNMGFEIQRISGLSFQWENLDFVNGSGTILNPMEYDYLDEAPPPGINYYRLKQVDFDGTASYSDVETVNLNDNLEIIMWPTLAKNQVLFKSNQEINPSIYRLRVFDLLGRKVIDKPFEQNLVLDISKLQKGQYIVHISSKQPIQILRFVKAQ